MKKFMSMVLCLLLLLTMAVPVHATETDTQPSGETTVTEQPAPHEHSWTATDTATCTAAGIKTSTCGCGETKTEESAAKGHSYGAATKVDDANHESVCSRCTDKVTAAHTWNEGVVTTQANCKQTGEKTYTCSACGDAKAEPIPTNGIHDWVKTESSAEHNCSVCGVRENHSFKEEITKQPTCKEEGSKKKYCTVCNYTETVVLTKLTTHTYDSACDPQCNVCPFTRETEHSFTKVWSKGYEGHWHECTKCGEKADFAKHTAGPAATEENDQVCTVCSYVITAKKEHKHTYETEWSHDKVGHWHDCTGKTCDAEKDYAAHVFDDDCDPDCNTCGFERENSHTYDTEGWQTTNFEHWNICSTCGEESEHEKHVAGPEASEESAQVCTICNFELEPKLEHTHAFGPGYLAGEDSHWQECECGELSVPEPHVWNAGSKTGKKTMTFQCTLCGEEKTEAVSSGFPWLTVLLVILALICIGGIVVLVFILKRGGFEEEDEEYSEESEEQEVLEESSEDFAEASEADVEDKMIDDFFASLDEEL